MKFASFDHINMDLWRTAGFAGAASSLSAFATWFVVGGSLGGGREAASYLVAAIVFYIVISTPRRLVDKQRVSQARESPLLSASAAACLAVAGSRSRTLLLLRAKDPGLADSIGEAGRRVLLGTRIEAAVKGSTRGLVSYSAAEALSAVASFSPRALDQGDEETRGLAASSDLSRETRVPVLMTICFFAPIMLTIYAVFSHSYDPVKLGELASFEFVLLDLAFYLGAADRGPR